MHYFQCALTLALNYNEIKKKELENFFEKIKREDIVFYHTKETGKSLSKTMSQFLLMSYLHHKIVKK